MADWNIKNILSYLPMWLIVAGLIYFNVHKDLTTITVQENSHITKMYFNAIVSPKDTYSLISPAEGVIINKYVEYGQSIKKGELLFSIHSPKTDESFHASVEEYIKAKQAYKNIAFKNTGIKELYELGLESKVSYLDSIGQLQDSKLALFQAEQKLKRLIEETGSKDINLDEISFENSDQIYKLLSNPTNNIDIIAPIDGTLFFPSKILGDNNTNNNNDSNDSKNDDDGKISKGSMVKEGQIIAVIGNMSSLFLNFKVNEAIVNDIKIGQPATITSASFKGIQLKGYVASIDIQANTSEYSGMQTYDASIIVPKISLTQRPFIQVGMSAEVTLLKKNPPMIEIPINAVFKKNDQYWVKVMINKDPDNIKDVTVIPGKTDEDSLQILDGLSPGDEIVIPN